MTTLYSSNFDSVTVGQVPPGWTSVSGGWSVTTDHPISGTKTFGGQLAMGSLAVYTAGSVAQTDQVAQVNFRYEGESLPYAAPMVRCSSDGRNGYLALLNQSSGNLMIFVANGGSYGLIANQPSAVSAGQNVTVEISATGSTIEGRVWTIGNQRPAAPTASVTHSAHAAGTLGLYWNQPAGGSSGVDDILWTDGAAAVAATAVTFLQAQTVGTVGVASGSFVVGANGDVTGSVTVTPSDNGGGGSFSPTSVTLSSGSPTGSFTYTPSSVGGKSITLTNTGGLSDPTAVTLVASFAAATTLTWSVKPAVGTVGSPTGNFTVSANGAISGTVVVTPTDSGGGGSFSPASVSLTNSNTSGSFAYTPGSAGTKTITVTNNGGLTNPAGAQVSVSISSSTFPVDSSAITWSPANWDFLDIGIFGVAAKTAQTTACGAYLKFSVTGTTSVTLALDTSRTAGFGANMPRLMWVVGDGAAQYAQVTDGDSSLTLAAGLTTGSAYSVDVFLLGAVESASDRWGTPTTSPYNVLRVTGVTLDAGGSLQPHPRVRPGKLVFYGDSLVEGVRAAGTTTEPGDHGRSAPWFAGPAMNCEYGVIGYGATGWNSSGWGNMPGFSTYWKYHSNSRPRSLSGVDYLFVMHGYNGGATVSDMQTWLAEVRASYPGLWVFVVSAPSGRNAASHIAGVNAYKAANPGESRIFSIDCSDRLGTANFNSSTGLPNFETIDGIHPLEWANAMIAAAIVQKAQAIISAASAATSARFSSRMPWRGR